MASELRDYKIRVPLSPPGSRVLTVLAVLATRIEKRIWHKKYVITSLGSLFISARVVGSLPSLPRGCCKATLALGVCGTALQHCFVWKGLDSRLLCEPR